MKLSERVAGFTVAVLALVADQGSKLALLYGADFVHLPPGSSIPLLPFLNLVMVWNPGISYGLLPVHSVPGICALVVLSMGAVSGLSYWLWNTHSRVLAIGLGLVIGGALGNDLIDRVLYGRVADFFHFYVFGYSWYVFNIADVAITLGAVAMIYELLKPQEAEAS
jgi:signal peptidase II